MEKRMNMPRRLKKLRPGNPHLIPPILGDPLRAKMAKEATAILKRTSKTSPSGSQARLPLRRSTPYSVQCYACAGWGHIARNCKPGGGRHPPRGRERQ